MNTEHEVDVVVVGAGVTGLAAATRLQSEGLSVLVLEARDRVGGRLLTERQDDMRIELGGQWVSANQHEVLGLLRDLDIATFPRYRAGSNVYVDRQGVRKTYDGDSLPVSRTTASEIARVVRTLDELTASIDPAAPWQHPDSQALDSITFDAWLATQTDDVEARDNVALCAGPAMLTKPAHSFSTLSALALAASVGSFSELTDENVVLDLRVSGGLAQLPARLAQDLGDAVILRSPVREVVWNEVGAIVRTAGTSYHARRVVMATPPHLVRTVKFSPPLPPMHMQLRDHLTMGSVIKINVGYASPFWRAAGLSGTAQSPYELVHEAYDNTNDDVGDARGVIVGFISDVQVDAVIGLSPEARKAAVLRSLSSYFGTEALEPVAYSESPWLSDEWTAGAYGTAFDVGSLVRYGAFVREPIGPISFGSSDVLGPGYLHVDGGIRVGRQLAEQVVQALGTLRPARPSLSPIEVTTRWSAGTP